MAGAGRCVTHLEGGPQALGGAAGGRLVARVDDGERAAPGPTSSPRQATSVSPTAWSMRLVLAPAAAAELEHGDADLAHVDRVYVAALVGPDLAGVRGAREVVGRVLEQVGGPAERGGHRGEALGGGAGAQRLLGLRAALGAVAGQAGEREALAAQRERDLEQPRLGVLRVGQHLERLEHLDRVAGGAAEDLVHVGQQRAAAQAVALGDLDDRLRELARTLALGP